MQFKDCNMLDKTYNEQSKQLISIDCSIFGYEKCILKILLFRRNIEPLKGKLSLVGGWVNDNESVEKAAFRVLENLTGLSDVEMEQVKVFSKPERDEGGRVITVSFNTLIKIAEHNIELDRDAKGQAFWNLHSLSIFQ